MSIIIKQFIEKSRSKSHSNRFLGCALSSGSCTVTLSYCSLHEPVQGDLFVLLPFLNLHSTWTRYQETVTVIQNCNYKVTNPVVWILSFCLSTLQFIGGTYI